jgi:hypothetical protein
MTMEDKPTILLIETAENTTKKKKKSLEELVESQKSAPLEPSSVRLITFVVPLTSNVLTHS